MVLGVEIYISVNYTPLSGAMPPKKRGAKAKAAAAAVEEELETEEAGSEVEAGSEEAVETMETEQNEESDNAKVESVEKEEVESGESEPPAKKSKVAEEALKKIEEEKKRKEREQKEAEEKAMAAKNAELEKFWKPVREDPSDFTAWTQLLQHADGKNEQDLGREVFNSFLKRYPYCYGYWKKFADFEKRNGTGVDVVSVFERGVAAIPLSADLWIHYINYTKLVDKDNHEAVRAVYEQAVIKCGREWKSDKLWDHFIKWEIEINNQVGYFFGQCEFGSWRR